MTQITLGSGTYMTGKLNAFEQFHCARRVAPLLAAMGITALQIAKHTAQPGAQAPGTDDFGEMLPMVFDQIARMPQADVDYILQTCLASCKRQQGAGWALLLVQGRLMFEDVGMPDMVQLVLATLKENLGSFFPMPQDASSSPTS